MNIWLVFYLVVLYISVAQTFLKHFKRYATSIGMSENSKLLLSAKIVAWTWPIFIPVEFLLQSFYKICEARLEKDLNDLDK